MSSRYQPLVKIASGGTAAVHVAVASGAQGFRQIVAVKKPHAHLVDDPAFVKALVEEAKIASRLHHANVVDVRDVVEESGAVDLVMDYVDGASLSDLIRAWIEEKAPDTRAVAIRVVLDACAGLSALHALAGEDGRPLGLVHRDVSPANVLVGVDGVARIADFGLAKALAADLRTRTREGELRGKVGYMAPEYVKGGASLDARVDVFAIGVVLWEALARKRLFRGENELDTLGKVQHLEAAPIGDADLDPVLRRALVKEPDERYPTMDALAADLERAAQRAGLVASHADVRASFPPKLREKLDARRKEVEAALASAPIAVVLPEPPVKKPMGLLATFIAILAVVAAIGFVSMSRDGDVAGPVRPREPRSAADLRVLRQDEPRQRAPEPEPSASAPSAPRAPGEKWPRPNPYSRSPR